MKTTRLLLTLFKDCFEKKDFTGLKIIYGLAKKQRQIQAEAGESEEDEEDFDDDYEEDGEEDEEDDEEDMAEADGQGDMKDDGGAAGQAASSSNTMSDDAKIEDDDEWETVPVKGKNARNNNKSKK
jgi:hypothetical protein